MPLIEVISSEENDPAVSSATKPATAAEVAAGIGALGLDPAQHHGGSEWSQVEPVGLTNTERAQMEELREKYGKYQRERDAVGGGALAPPEGGQQLQRLGGLPLVAHPQRVTRVGVEPRPGCRSVVR